MRGFFSNDAVCPERIGLDCSLMLLFCVLHLRCRGTGVNVLEKSDLGQCWCLHLSHWQATAAAGGSVVLNKGGEWKTSEAGAASFKWNREEKPLFDREQSCQPMPLCYKQPFHRNLITFTYLSRIRTVWAWCSCLLPSVVLSCSFLPLNSPHFHLCFSFFLHVFSSPPRAFNQECTPVSV